MSAAFRSQGGSPCLLEIPKLWLLLEMRSELVCQGPRSSLLKALQVTLMCPPF